MMTILFFPPFYRVYSNVPDKPTTPEKNTKRKSWNKMAGSLLTKVKTFKQNYQNQPQQSQQQPQQQQQQQQRPVYGSIDVEQARLKREKEFELLLGQQEQQQQPQQQHSSKQPTYSQVDVERAQFLREQRTRQQQQQNQINSHNQTSNSNSLNQNFPCCNQYLTKFNWYHGKISQVKKFFIL